MKTLFTISFFLIVLLLFSIEAGAHRIRVFAYENGGKIYAEAVFNGGKPAKDSEVLVQNGNTHTLLYTTTTDANGKTHFPIPEEAKSNQIPLDIIVDMGEGHRNHWLLNPEDYLATTSPTVQPTKVVKQKNVPRPPADPVNEEQLKKLIGEALDEKLAPLKRMIAQNMEKGPSLKDILGGLGYIFGIAGIVAYMNAKKRTNLATSSLEESNHNG
jgi:nickel transport protein